MRWEEPTGLPFASLAAGGFLAIGLILITVATAAIIGEDWWFTLYEWTVVYYVGWCIIVILASTKRTLPIRLIRLKNRDQVAEAIARRQRR